MAPSCTQPLFFRALYTTMVCQQCRGSLPLSTNCHSILSDENVFMKHLKIYYTLFQPWPVDCHKKWSLSSQIKYKKWCELFCSLMITHQTLTKVTWTKERAKFCGFERLQNWQRNAFMSCSDVFGCLIWYFLRFRLHAAYLHHIDLECCTIRYVKLEILRFLTYLPKVSFSCQNTVWGVSLYWPPWFSL